MDYKTFFKPILILFNLAYNASEEGRVLMGYVYTLIMLLLAIYGYGFGLLYSIINYPIITLIALIYLLRPLIAYVVSEVKKDIQGLYGESSEQESDLIKDNTIDYAKVKDRSPTDYDDHYDLDYGLNYDEYDYLDYEDEI